MMVLVDNFNPVLLKNDESFLAWLDPELLEIQETEEQGCLTTLSITYPIEDILEAKELFKIGNKIWIPEVNGLRACLYIINESINEDLFEDNCVTFDVEDVLSELNYAPLFSQTDVTQANLGTYVQSDGTFIVCKSALEYFFGDYFTIDNCEPCSNEYIAKINPCGTMTLMELLRFIEDETNNVFRTRYEKSDKDNTIIRYLDFLNPTRSTLCREHEGIIDLGYNAENIQYEIDESDTFRAIAPELSLNESEGSVSSTNQLTRAELNTVISEFENLSASTNTSVPMIVQKGSGVYPTKDEGVVGNYWRRGVTDNIVPHSTLLTYKEEMGAIPSTSGNKVGDFYKLTSKVTYNNTEIEAGSLIVWNGSKWVVVTNSDNKEFYIATAYWKPPFPKHSGELYVADEEITGCQYTQIRGKNYADTQITTNGFKLPSEFTTDAPDEMDIIKLPKIGTVSTSDTDVYAIYNDCCTKLIEKRYPSFNMEIDIKDLNPTSNSAYNLYDTVKIKVPGYEKYITANVQKTVKDPHNIGENSISLSNVNIGSKIVQKSTSILGKNINMAYGNSKSLELTLICGDENVTGQLVTLAVLKKEDNSESYTYTGTTYNKTTNSNGKITLPIKWKPGYYQVEATFGGNLEYGMCSDVYKVTVTGTYIETPKISKESDAEGKVKVQLYKTKTKTKKVKTYFDKYGRSPDGKYICSVGKPSASGESSKYNYKYFYKSIFKKKCPFCGSTNLVWGIFWAGNETSNYGKFLGKTEGGNAEGHIFCLHCDADFSAIDGKDHSSPPRAKLKKVKKTVKVGKAQAYLLKKGKMPYGNKKVKVKVKEKYFDNITPPTRLDRTKYSCPYESGPVSTKVVSKSLSFTNAKTDVEVAKPIVEWISKNIEYEHRKGFYQSPATTLKRRQGNDCCQTDLLAHILDSLGLLGKYPFQYMYSSSNSKYHVFAKVGSVYIDVSKTKDAWGSYITKFGKPTQKSTYPCLPIKRNY